MYNPDKECKAMVEKLNNIYKMKNISLRTLAKKSKVSTSTISCLLSGKTKPHVYTVLLLCNVLEISICELFDDGGMMNHDNMTSTDERKTTFQPAKVEEIFPDNKDPGLSNEEKELLCYYRHLSDEKKNLLKIFIDMLHQYSE